MERIPEPELMDDDEQALAYASADFSQPHERVIALFRETFGPSLKGYVLDLGCGPGDISMRFARAYPHCVVHGIDGADAMLRIGRKSLEAYPEMKDRVVLFHGLLPDAEPPFQKYDAVISNSLLHHLEDPQIMWKYVKKYSKAGAPVFIVDLKRPSSPEEARLMVETYSGSEPEILKRDFYNSLLAAFTPHEIAGQIGREGIDYLDIREISDRHLVICGHLRHDRA